MRGRRAVRGCLSATSEARTQAGKKPTRSWPQSRSGIRRYTKHCPMRAQNQIYYLFVGMTSPLQLRWTYWKYGSGLTVNCGEVCPQLSCADSGRIRRDFTESMRNMTYSATSDHQITILRDVSRADGLCHCIQGALRIRGTKRLGSHLHHPITAATQRRIKRAAAA